MLFLLKIMNTNYAKGLFGSLLHELCLNWVQCVIILWFVYQDLRESQRMQESALEKLRNIKEEKIRELKKRKQEELEKKRREEEEQK